MTQQEQNWELVVWTGISWKDTVKLSDDDRSFLLAKATELKDQHAQQMAAQEKMYKEQMAAQQANQPTHPNALPQL